MRIRTTQPKNNKYYIRQVSGGYNGAVAGMPTISGANVLCNCVGYANGRFNEIGGYGKCKYQLVCNAENFIESAKRQGLKISKVPTVGGIMVWQRGATLGGGDGAGHVAVVEEIYDDGSILTSESGWNAWAFKNVRRTNKYGRWGQSSAYKFRGCIINPAVKDGKVMPTPKLSVDGICGEATIRATQQYFHTPQDGVLSGQNKELKKYYPNITAVTYGRGGSACVKKIQKWVKVTQDGVLGEKTIKAWQKKIGVKADGVFGEKSAKAWQRYLNQRLFADNANPTGPPKPTEPEKQVEPTPTASVYKVIDVSDWQGKINWKKVKASGIVGAIIRYADGDVLDKRFMENMENAKDAGLHIGCYIFSRAKTKAQAEKEAKRLYNASKPYAPDMPLYIDLEVSSLSKYANTVAQAFIKKMDALGGRGGVYANLNWWNNYLVDTAKKYNASPFWIAQYNDKMTHKNPSLFGMWQYSSSGKVNGISGNVDMDKCYVAYWDNAPTTEPTKPTEDTSDTEAQKNRDSIIAKGNEWCRRIASDNRYHYVLWKEKDAQTHKCPICSKVDYETDPKHFGWNCIGAAWAVWHHGMGLPCKCNCHVISNEVAEEILKAKTDAEALAIARKYVGMNDIEVIRNKGNNIPHSDWKPGDVCLMFSGETYNHTFYFMGDGKIFDSTGSSGKVSNDNQIRIRSWDKYTAKVIIRWTDEKVVK